MLENLIGSITKNEYLITLIYLVIFFALIRFGILILERIILKLTTKTKTDLDDIIIAKSSKPLTFAALTVGLRIALSQMSSITFEVVQTLNRILDSIVGVIIIYLIYVIFDASYSRVWKRIARRQKTNPNEGLIQLTKATLKVVLFMIGVLYILSIWGVEIGPLLAGLGIGGIAIAFALQSSLANIFGGVSMILDKSVNVGDLVVLDGGVSGKILKIGIRSTKVKTFDNEIVIVPNAKLADSNINNIAQPDPIVRVVVPFGVAYGSDVDKVKKIVLSEIKKVKNLVSDPEPHVKFLEMADSSLNFKAYFFVETFDVRLSALDEANTRIYNALNKAGIEIPFPQVDVHVKK